MELVPYLVVVAHVLFGALAITSWLRWRRQPTGENLDVAVMLGTLAIPIVTGALVALGVPGWRVFEAIGNAAIMSHPLALCRLVWRFRPPQAWFQRFVFAGTFASIVIVAVFPVPVPVVFGLLLVAFFVLVESWSAVELVRGAVARTGPARMRMGLAAFGSILLAAVIFLAGFMVADPAMEMVIAAPIQLMSLVSAVAYVLGFTPPRRLLRAWQSAELGRWLDGWIDRDPEDRGALSELCRRIPGVLGSNSALVAVRSGPSELTLTDASGANRGTLPLEGPLHDLWTGARESFRGTLTGLGHVIAAPVPSQGACAALSLALYRREPLLSDADEGLLILLGRLVGAELGWTDRLEVHAQEARLRLSSLVESSNDAIHSEDLDGRITSWNRAAEQTYGWTLDEVVGRTVDLIVPEELREQVRADHQAIFDGAPERSLRTQRVTKDGRRLDIWLTLSPLVQGGRLVGLSGIARDITARAEAERRLETARAHLQQNVEELARSNEELERFAYVASHDLKAPLRGITTLAHWIAEDLPQDAGDEVQEHLRLLVGRANRMERLLDDLLRLARAGRGGSVEEIELGDLLAELPELAQAPEGFEVRVPKVDLRFETAAASLTQVLLNLIGNAVKHHPGPPGVVEVGVREVGAMLEFTVRDDGAGIEARFHERIFEAFQTLKPRDEVEGSGMGLAIVKKVVLASGGEVGLESEVGKGSTFRFTWPRRPRALRSDKVPA